VETGRFAFWLLTRSLAQIYNGIAQQRDISKVGSILVARSLFFPLLNRREQTSLDTVGLSSHGVTGPLLSRDQPIVSRQAIVTSSLRRAVLCNADLQVLKIRLTRRVTLINVINVARAICN
jgi:hypothetical protein